MEAKASFLFAVDTGLLGLTSANLHREYFDRLPVVLLALLFLGLMLGSLYCTYRCVFPNLRGGSGSLIYFREIANHTEGDYVETFLARSDADHASDVAGQVWINAKILKSKFDYLKIAFSLTFLAILPWVALSASIAA